jgi:hypothetical protein
MGGLITFGAEGTDVGVTHVIAKHDNEVGFGCLSGNSNNSKVGEREN